MKRAVVLLIAGIVLLASIPAFAQTQPGQPQAAQDRGYPKEAYVKNISLIRVLVHPLGYKVLFWKSGLKIGEMYIPLTWFSGGAVAKAQITYGSSPDRPYLSISWVDGKFDHLIINAQSDMMGPTWGTMDPNTDLTAQFNIQEPPTEF